MKFLTLWISLLALHFHPLFAQESGQGTGEKGQSQKQTDEKSIYRSVEQTPEFPGGQSALYKFLSRNLRYPPQAVKKGIKGKVIAEFYIDEEGNLKEPKIVRGLGYGCDEEVLRVLSLSPKWHPGRQSGKAVSTYFSLPVSFFIPEPVQDPNPTDKE